MKKIDTTPLDRKRIPPRQALWAMPVVWIWSIIATASGHLKIKKERMKGLKPPYLLLGTHHAFNDFCVTPLAIFPHRANYVSELEGFEAYGEWAYRKVGCLGTRKFIDDLSLIRNIRNVINRGDILVMYPEARYANVGTSSEIPESVGKLAKMLKVPLVTINMHGNYLQSPIWNLKKRREVPLEAEIKQLFTKEELEKASVKEINDALKTELSYNEYEWQLKNRIKVTAPFRAEGLHMVLYKCPCCGSNGSIKSSGSTLFCSKCSSKWNMTEYGELEEVFIADKENYPFEHLPEENISIPAWYEWERQTVEKEIDERKYYLETEVHIESLPNAKNFINCGNGKLIHKEDGFYLAFTDYGNTKPSTLFVPSETLFSVHTEYAYRDKYGMCITISTLDNTYFIFPKESERIARELSEKTKTKKQTNCGTKEKAEEKSSLFPPETSFFNPTRIQFATEYFYKLRRNLIERK